MSAQEQMDKDIENNDMVSVKAAREMLNAATKKARCCQESQNWTGEYMNWYWC